MFAYLSLGLSLLLFALALRIVWRSCRLAGRHKALLIFFSAMLAVFAYLYGPWAFGSIYLRNVLAACWLLTAGVATFRRRPAQLLQSKGTIALATLAVLLLILDVLFFTGTAADTGYADLQFSLKGSRYLVLQGGKGLPANVFHYNSRHAVFAMDIVKLDDWGRRGRRIFSKRLEDYFIFGDTIYAPCAGIVLRAVDDNPDNTPPERRRGPHNLNGVVIEGIRCSVFLGHMQQGKVFVRAGQTVVAGQPLGLAGNSGMSIEPHLHIQAHALGTDGQPWYRQPQLFMRFNGKSYLPNDVIRP